MKFVNQYTGEMFDTDESIPIIERALGEILDQFHYYRYHGLTNNDYLRFIFQQAEMELKYAVAMLKKETELTEEQIISNHMSNKEKDSLLLKKNQCKLF